MKLLRFGADITLVATVRLEDPTSQQGRLHDYRPPTIAYKTNVFREVNLLKRRCLCDDIFLDENF